MAKTKNAASTKLQDFMRVALGPNPEPDKRGRHGKADSRLSQQTRTIRMVAEVGAPYAADEQPA